MTNFHPPVSGAPARPFALDPLFRPLATLPGVGEKLSGLLTKHLHGGRVVDLLFHAPIDVIDHTYRPDLHHAIEGRIATITVDIIEHRPNKRSNLPYKIIAGDGVGYVDLVFFNVRGNYLETQYPVNGSVTVCGKLERFAGKWQMAHPEKLTDSVEAHPFESVYPLTAGITNRMIGKFTAAALKTVPILSEWQDEALLAREKWPRFSDALSRLHHLTGPEDLSPQSTHRRRLAYDELLAGQLALYLMRERERGLKGRAFPLQAAIREKFLALLPFRLTSAQRRALDDIDADMAAPTRMMRLLQGDVGSGKTIVAALAMLNAVASGVQAAIMVPTEILAQQHAATFRDLFSKMGIGVEVLTGRHKGPEREKILSRIQDGSAKIIIGTHALFQDTVDFHDLGMVVIDEQHRFGVHQRFTLTRKGIAPDMLVMTATPIPRTLALTAFGDLDLSAINEKPPGRQTVDTRLIPLLRYPELIEGLAKQITSGTQVYWVCPLVEESEMLDLTAATDRYEMLKNRFGPGVVGLIHGRMKSSEKDDVMRRFASGQIHILVATTVIEVGVNVPNATCMVIEHAERFGLSQLHQLRGRVGRGHEKSYCFLLYHPDCGKVAQERLKIMRDTEDGFLIAEKDLTLRGPGDILGTQQSGLLEGRLADLAQHSTLLDMARDDARLIIDKDPKLQTPRGQALRHLLYLFERDQAIKLLQAG